MIPFIMSHGSYFRKKFDSKLLTEKHTVDLTSVGYHLINQQLALAKALARERHACLYNIQYVASRHTKPSSSSRSPDATEHPMDFVATAFLCFHKGQMMNEIFKKIVIFVLLSTEPEDQKDVTFVHRHFSHDVIFFLVFGIFFVDLRSSLIMGSIFKMDFVLC